MELAFKLSENENLKLQKLFYTKLGLENLINSQLNNRSESFDILINEYGKACSEFDSYGMKLCNDYTQKKSLDIVPIKWECNFESGELTVSYKK